MTVKEYLTATLSRFQLSEGDIDLIMLNQNLSEGVINVMEIKTAIYNEFSSLIPLVDVSEGTMSVKWNIAALRTWYSLLAKELGKEDVLASIGDAQDREVNNASFYW